MRRTQRSRSEATQAALVSAARTLFGQNGYAAANLADLVADASVTRGALYHHFSDKSALFEAVATEVAGEVSETASMVARASGTTTWTRFLNGLRIYIAVVGESQEAQRILLVDGPAVLGWERWRRLQGEVVLPGMIYGIAKLMEEGQLRQGEPEILAHLILAALNDAAMAVANAPDPGSLREPVMDALTQLIEGLRSIPENKPIKPD